MTREFIKRFKPTLVLFAFLILSPISLISQNTITLKLEKVTLTDFFKAIEKKSNVKFSYLNEEIDNQKDVTIHVTNESIEVILQQVLSPKGYTFQRTGNTVAITRKKQQITNHIKKKYSGIVTDDNESPIIGATVRIEGSNIGTITDLNGKFSLEAPIGDNLLVSYMGYDSQKTELTTQTNIKVKLKEDTKVLDEVVVVGYGTIKKSDLTGSISQLKAKNQEEKAYSSIEQMIQGRMSGVQITQNSGALGGGMTFSIRGANSVSGSNQPLMVIDGYPVESGTIGINAGSDPTFTGDVPGQNILSLLNPNDIESIEVLKDASATAIYGSRGANGVVMVTTKSGKSGKDKVEYSFRTDVSSLPKKLSILNTNDYIAYSNEAYLDRNDGTLAFTVSDFEKYSQVNTNWQDLVYQTGLSQNHQLNLSGGDKKLQYALGFGYLSQNGIVKNTSFDRGTLRLNLNKIVNTRFKFGFNCSGTMSVNNAVNQSARSGDVSASIVNAALKTPPVYKAYEADDIAYATGIANPLLLITKVEDKSRLTQIMISGFADYLIIKDLIFKIRLGVNNTDGLRQYYMPRGTYLGDVRKGYAYNGNIKNFDYLTEYTLSYKKSIKKHWINGVGGYTWQWWNRRFDGISAGGFPNDNFKYYNINSASSIDKPVNGTSEWALASILGRINYAYDNKYLLTLTARTDGATRLAVGKKWKLFPSIALGWNIHKEDFMRNHNLITELKLRASYGESGNQTVAVGSTLASYGTTTAVINEQVSTVYYPQNMENKLLTWENTKQANIGFNISLLNNRFTLSSDYYYKLTDNLLINLPIPASTGFTQYTSNAGIVENSGLEFDVSAKILTGNFTWGLTGNISFNQNKILKFDGKMNSFIGEAFGSINGQPLHIAKIGNPIGSFYGYKITGIYQTQEEINASPIDPANPKPGSFRYEDISGPDGIPDGLISSYDRTIIGNPYPDYILGLTNEFSWKQFSLNIFIQGSIGQDIINGNRFYLDALTRTTNTNVSTEAYQNRWTGPGTSNKYPMVRSNTLPFDGRFTDFIVEDGSFIRLKDVTFSYSINPKSIKPIQTIKLFVTGNNLLTFTKYTGYDPEINSRGSNSMTPGVDGGSIPQFRTISAGFNIIF